MKEFASGSLVRHRTLGTGKIVAVESTALHVFFPASDTRYAAKLRWPESRVFLSQDDVPADPWLEALNSFSMDPASSRYALAANFVSQDEAIGIFLADHPAGFEETPPSRKASARLDRRQRWRAASAEWTKAMGGGKSAELLEDGEYQELARRALRVALLASPVRRMPEPDVLEEAFTPGDEVRHFLDALLGFLSVPSPARPRFDRLCAATNELGVPAEAAWPLVTYFPFVAVPDRHVLLVPSSAGPAASRLGWDLQYRAAPNWATYVRWRDLSNRLLEKLAPSGARDHVDVEYFLHATGTRRPDGSARGPRAAASHRARHPAPAKASPATPRSKR